MIWSTPLTWLAGTLQVTTKNTIGIMTTMSKGTTSSVLLAIFESQTSSKIFFHHGHFSRGNILHCKNLPRTFGPHITEINVLKRRCQNACFINIVSISNQVFQQPGHFIFLQQISPPPSVRCHVQNPSIRRRPEHAARLSYRSARSFQVSQGCRRPKAFPFQ